MTGPAAFLIVCCVLASVMSARAYESLADAEAAPESPRTQGPQKLGKRGEDGRSERERAGRGQHAGERDRAKGREEK